MHVCSRQFRCLIVVAVRHVSMGSSISVLPLFFPVVYSVNVAHLLFAAVHCHPCASLIRHYGGEQAVRISDHRPKLGLHSVE